MTSTLTNKEILIKERKKSNRKKNWLGYLFSGPYLIAFIGFFIVPLVWGIITSFFKYNPYDSTVFEFVGFKNYLDILNIGDSPTAKVYGPIFWSSFFKTTLFDLIAVPCLIIIPLLLAYLINLQPPGHKIFRAIIYFPSLLSVATMGVVFVNFFGNSETGFINSIIGQTIRWLDATTSGGVEILRWTVILLASIWWQTGRNFIIFSAGLKDVDKTLYEAGKIDGCSKFQQFIYVTVPALKNQVVICLFTTLIGYMNLYAQPSVIHSANNKQGFLINIETPLQLIQTTISDPAGFAKTGLMSATGLVFGIFVIIISGVQMKVTGERKGGNKYGKRFQKYIEAQEKLQI